MEGRPHEVNSFLMRGGGVGTDPFCVVTSDRIRGKGLKLCPGRFRLNIKKRFFTQTGFGHWNRPPREVVTAGSLRVQKPFGQRFQSDGVILGVVLAQELDCNDPCGSLSAQHTL